MTSFIDRLKGSVSGQGPFRSEPPKPKEKSATTVRTNRFDEQVWTRVRPTEKVDGIIYDLSIGDTHHGGERDPFDGAPELVHDLFFTFYKAAAEVRSKREVTAEAYPVRALIEQIMSNPRLDELQPLTAGDAAMSTIAVDSIMDSVRELLVRFPKPPERKKKKVHVEYTDEVGDPLPPGDGEPPDTIQVNPDAPPPPPQPPKPPSEWDIEYDNDVPSGDDDGGDGSGNQGGDGESNFDPDSENAEDQEETDWQSMFDDLLSEVDMDRIANKALQAAEDEVSDIDNMRRGIGIEDGEWLTMSPERRLQIAERLRTNDMRTLANSIGRMTRLALGVRATRVIDVPHEIYDVEMGNDIRRVLKSEFALLADHRASYEFYRRYAGRELMQFKMRGTEDVGKGPIQCVIDKSGSMDGEPFEWAMAVSEALRRFASDDDRDFHAMFFGNNNDRERFDFPGGKAEFEKIMAFLSCRANGGTQFDGVLTEALERAEKCFTGEGKGKADIVFITDGQAHLDDEWIEDFNRRRNEAGVRLYAVFIGGAYDMTYQGGPVSLLERIADVVIPVSDLRPESASAIFERV